MVDDAEGDTADFSDDADNPFDPANVGTINFIMLARIYDLLLLDLMDRKPETAKKVLEAHRRGAIMGTAPVLSGDFLSDPAD